MSEESAARDATSAQGTPRGSGDPVVDANTAWTWAGDYFNRRAGLYALQIIGLQIALSASLGG